jgi:hypothetical protein
LEEDRDLRLITARKMAELRRRAGQAAAAAAAASPPKGEKQQQDKSDREIVLGMLYDRGDEVLEAATARYPTETKQIIGQLARMIREKKLVEKLSGGELLSALRSLGMRVSLNTTIRVEDHGRFVTLADKLRKNDEEKN